MGRSTSPRNCVLKNPLRSRGGSKHVGPNRPGLDDRSENSAGASAFPNDDNRYRGAADLKLRTADENAEIQRK